ncbi:MAG: hypothetical protein L6R41_005459 [Letrouitia leprolyta]|nr:MAG: hypothetical protein L6R41_005459 [Letrouitia leprolyta]
MEQRSKPSDKEPSQTSVTRDPSEAFSSRVRASTSALVRETVLCPTPISNLIGLASSTVNAGKSSIAQVFPESSAVYTPPSSSKTDFFKSAADGARNYACQTLQSNSTSWNRWAVEAEFGSFLAEESSWSGTDTRGYCVTTNGKSWQCEEATARFIKNGPDTFKALATSASLVTSTPDLRDDQTDGAVVVALLSDPSFDINNLPSHQPASVDQRASQVIGNYFMDQGSREISPLAYSHLFSLIPDFSRDPASPHVDALSQDSASRTHLEGESGNLPRLIYDDEDSRIEPWLEILTRYHNDVWGGMHPNVNAAYEANVLQTANEDHRRYCPAMRRLAMVVGHVKEIAS